MARAFCGRMCAAARIQAATPAPVAAEMLTRIGALYDIERDIRGKSAETRKNARDFPRQADHGDDEALAGDQARGDLAFRYTLSRWDGLVRFLDYGRVDIDSNTIERAMLPIALGRKIHIFAGPDNGAEHWSVAYLADGLTKIMNRHPMSCIVELLPFAYIADFRQNAVV